MTSSTPTSLTLVVLAAGLGTRYGDVKQLDRVGPGGATLMDYALGDAWRAGFGRAVVVVRPEIERAVASRLKDHAPNRMELTFVRQALDDLPENAPVVADRERPWGTAHAVWCARHAVTGSFVVANADDYYGPSAYRALAGSLAGSTDSGPWAVAGYRLKDVLSVHGGVNRGICEVSEDGWLEDITEGKELKGDREGVTGTSDRGEPLRLRGDEAVSVNLWGFTRSVMTHLEEGFRRFLRGWGRDPVAEYLLPNMVRDAIRPGGARVKVLEVDGPFFGITHPEDRPDVVRRLAERGPPWDSVSGGGP